MVQGRGQQGMAELKQDLSRITLAVLFIAALIAAWPIMRWVQARLWNSRALAVTIMTLTLLVLFVVPFWLATATVVRNAGQIPQWVESISTMEMPLPPAWVTDIPLIGDR